MRIIAGQFKGRTIKAPGPGTRPMTEQLRGALFNILGSLDGMRVLDAYAGTGAIGFEALSRGAKYVEAIELGSAACRVIERNAEALGIRNQFHLYCGSVENWLKTAAEPFDLILAGPPFAALYLDVITRLGQGLRAGGLMVLWQSSRLPVAELAGVTIERTKQSGDSTLVFYRR